MTFNINTQFVYFHPFDLTEYIDMLTNSTANAIDNGGIQFLLQHFGYFCISLKNIICFSLTSMAIIIGEIFTILIHPIKLS